jgi:hypothetical protein
MTSWPQEIRDLVIPKTFEIHRDDKSETFTIQPGSLFEDFLAFKREKLPPGTIVKIQAYHLTKDDGFVNFALITRDVTYQLCRDQNNEDIYLKALYALDDYVNCLKKHLAVYGEILPESPEEVVVMEVMES